MLYGDLSGFRSYAAGRGNSAPTDASDPLAQAALQRASDYVEYFYVADFVAVPDEAIIVDAVYEAATVELAKPGLFNRTYTPGEAKVLTEAKGIRWTVVGDAAADGAMMPVSTIIEAMLGRYVGRNAGFGLRAIG